MIKNILLVHFAIMVGVICHAQQRATQQTSLLQSSMIWMQTGLPGSDSYVAFRKTFNLNSRASGAVVQLFADSRYLLWINGKYVLRGPCRFNPKRPEYDEVPVGSFIQKGKNSIVVLVHHYTGGVNGRIIKHDPGLGLLLKVANQVVVKTDTDWRCNNNTRYKASSEAWSSIPDIIDGRVDNEEWMLTGFNDAAWGRPVPVDGDKWGLFHARQIPLLRERPLENLVVLPSGNALSRLLPVVLQAGQEMLVDFGKMSLAYTSMRLDADDSSVVHMQYALQYVDGKPKELYGAGNTYTARKGLQHFITTDQWTSRYMLVKCLAGSVRILAVNIVERLYPFERIGTFNSSDTLLNQIWDRAVNTIATTSEDGYGSDARERNEWIQDASKPSYSTTRVSMARKATEGFVYSDPALLKNMLRHAALSQLPDGRMLATFPTDRGPEDCHYVIDDYSCQWFEALQTYYDATGDKAFVAEMWPALTAQIQWFLDRRTQRGLLLAREYASFDNPLAYITCEGATINAFFYKALQSCEYLAKETGRQPAAVMYRKAAAELKQAYNLLLWNDKAAAFNAGLNGDTIIAPTVHAQLIALHYALVPAEHIASVRKFLLENYKNPAMMHGCKNPDVALMVSNKSGVGMPVIYHWMFTELYRINSSKMDNEAIDEMRRRWQPMVYFLQSAGTLAESFIDEKGEGSTEACHNYGATPAYFLSTYILGVRRDAPVWKKRLVIEPRLGDLSKAEGTVVTEHGCVDVSWKKLSYGKSYQYSFSLPKGVSADVHLPLVARNGTLSFNKMLLVKNGVPAKTASLKGNWIVIRNVMGNCSGSFKINP